jgi:outer membrane receptor protein involved in Fe transport
LDAKTSNPFLKTGDDLLSPNTSPHRVNLTASYTKQQEWDASITMRYVEGFNWLAGDFKGFVPSFTVVNLNAGVNITNDLRLGLVVNNLFDRRYYEVYGGSILPRLTYLSATYSFD